MSEPSKGRGEVVRRLAARLWSVVVAVSPATILIAGFAAFLVYSWPGFLSADSVIQLAEARAGRYTDWHPPMMAWIWRPLDRIVAGPILMLLLQGGTFLWGLHRLLARVLSPRLAALVAVVVLLFPPVLVPLAVIWKDCLMAGCLLAGGALLLEPGWRRALGVLFLFVAAGMRHNALPALLPLVVLACIEAWRRPLWQRMAVGTLASLAIAGAAVKCNSVLTDEPTYPWYGSVALLDVAGTLRYAPPLPEAEVERLLRDSGYRARPTPQAFLRGYYDPRTWWNLTHGELRLWDPPEKEIQRRAIRRAWVELVRTYPGAYLTHRRRVFNEVLAHRQTEWWPVYRAAHDGSALAFALGLSHRNSPLQDWLGERMDKLGSTSLLRPWAYFWLSLLLLAVFAWRRHRLAVAVLCSGLFYEVGLFLAAPSPDFRYSHWMIVCVCAVLAAAAAAALRRLAGLRPRPGPTT